MSRFNYTSSVIKLILIILFGAQTKFESLLYAHANVHLMLDANSLLTMNVICLNVMLGICTRGGGGGGGERGVTTYI